MKKFFLLILLAIFAGGAYGGYILFFQKKGIRPRHRVPLASPIVSSPAAPPVTTSSTVATSGPVTAGEETQPADKVKEEPPSKTVDVEPSKDLLEDFPATITVKDGDKEYTVQYTGQFRRSKRFLIELNTYDIASYVQTPKKGKTAELLDDLLVDGEAKVYMLRFINALPGRQITNDIYDAINESFGDVDVDRLKEGIDTFAQQFSVGSSKGDIVYIVWLPGGVVYSGFKTKDNLSFLAKDVPFARALWRIWAGPKYGDKRLTLVHRFAHDPATSKK